MPPIPRCGLVNIALFITLALRLDMDGRYKLGIFIANKNKFVLDEIQSGFHVSG